MIWWESTEARAWIYGSLTGDKTVYCLACIDNATNTTLAARHRNLSGKGPHNGWTTLEIEKTSNVSSFSFQAQAQATMSTGSLTIRNVTSFQIELQVWEKFPSPVGLTDGSKDEAQATTGLLATLWTSSASNAAPIEKATQTFDRHDVSVPIAAFTSVETPFDAPARDSAQAVRLTLAAGAPKYRLDLPTPAGRSTTLTPLTPDPPHEFTAVYLPETSYLALYSSAHLDAWMAALPDATPLAALSIPGTHNSPTHHRALPSVRCQAVPPRAQLAHGVRFLDVRVQPARPADPAADALVLVHSAFPVALTGARYFRALLEDVGAFLAAHARETVLMSVKREGTGGASDSDLARVLRDHYTGPQPERWFVEPRVPMLGEVRGKIVLVRRFGLPDGFGDRGFGLDGSAWADNTPHATCPSGHLCVQDFYELGAAENVGKKLLYAQEHLARCAAVDAAARPAPPLFVNFLSASNFWRMDLWPEKIAARINPAVVEYLCRRHGHGEDGSRAPGCGGTGVVVCDWVGNQGDWDLVRCIVGMNSRLIS